MAKTPSTVTAKPASVAKSSAPPQTAQEKADQAEVAALLLRQHGRRLIKAIDSGYVLMGVRISDPKTDHANGEVITLFPNESKQVLDVIRKLIEARR